MRVLVLGAGVVGTTTAWYLAQAGHQVTVLDRQPCAGNETSFANGGQISVSHAEPWANPHVLPLLLKWLGRPDAPLRWHWRADLEQLLWGLHFLRECWPGRTRQNIQAIVHLALYSRACLQTLRAEQSLEYDQLSRGILHIYTEVPAYEQAQGAAALMRDFGLDRETVNVAQCLEIEPSLTHAKHLLVGGDYTPSDESGDAHRFTQTLASIAAAKGVSFRFSHQVDRIECDASGVRGVWAKNLHDGVSQHLDCDACVVALGSFSRALLRPLGVTVPVFPAKGYSATLTLPEGSEAPMVSITDDERRIVFSRLGQRLRVAGTAEFDGYNLALDPRRCAALIERTRTLFPGLEWAGEPVFWGGLRPATPSNVPLIGAAGPKNLWLNTGHGTLGWTLSCGSAAALADLISGKSPAPDFPFLLPS